MNMMKNRHNLWLGVRELNNIVVPKFVKPCFLVLFTFIDSSFVVNTSQGLIV